MDCAILSNLEWNTSKLRNEASVVVSELNGMFGKYASRIHCGNLLSSFRGTIGASSFFNQSFDFRDCYNTRRE